MQFTLANKGYIVRAEDENRRKRVNYSKQEYGGRYIVIISLPEGTDEKFCMFEVIFNAYVTNEGLKTTENHVVFCDLRGNEWLP